MDENFQKKCRCNATHTLLNEINQVTFKFPPICQIDVENAYGFRRRKKEGEKLRKH